MPREIIGNCDGGPWFAKVGWASGQNMQLGVANDEGMSLFWLLLGPDAEMKAKLGQALIEEFGIVTGPTEGDNPFVVVAERFLNMLDTQALRYDGLWTHLDREGANRLIATLRKARDSAFGKDE